jgi:asparagine synthase (glutamine-hydrolysing)
MCGIAGEIRRDGRVDHGRFARMLSTLEERGPDGHGVRLLDDGRVALGHTRLAIIDLTPAAAQPMCNEDGTVWLVFNGEIYNHPELRKRLAALGHSFRSRSDSEVIIHAWEEWGTECVSRLRGIFAFGVYDCASRSLFLARDHVGVKPLFYHAGPATFLFASQPRALLEAGVPRSPDPAALSLYLAYGNVPAQHCAYAGIRKLLPGHWLLLKDGSLDVRRYWSARYAPLISDPAEARDGVRRRIEDCVNAQAISDVPIGTLLSGGVDSTIITSILAEPRGRELSTFTMGFDAPESDERPFARLVADACGTTHRDEELACEAAMHSLPDVIDAFDEPFDLNGLFPYHALARMVRDTGLKVVLGGDGADELFAGYRWYERWGATLQSDAPRWRRWFGAGRAADPVERFFRINGYMDPDQQIRFAGPSLAPLSLPEILTPLGSHWRPELPPVLAAQILDFHCFLPDHCLAKVDRAGMASGVEVRVPFLDVDLIEFVFSIDHRITFAGGERKALLKSALQARLPRGMDVHRKKGFSSPVERWLEHGFAAAGRRLIEDGSLCGSGWLSASAVRRDFDRLPHRVRLLLISCELWFRRWIERDRIVQLPDVPAPAAVAGIRN